MRNTLYALPLLVLPLFTLSQNVEYKEFDLKNGLHVIIHEDHSTPIAVVSVMYHVGSKDEDPDLTGFAHFFEHLLFEGSPNIGRGEYAKYVENAGGMLNANTTQDRTYYYQVLPSNQLELGLWLESERMLHATVDQVGINTQREVVKEEKRMRYDDKPYGTIMQEVMERAYEKHPYRWLPIGSMEHIDAASEQDFKDFYKKFYVPNNAVLVVAGDVNTDNTVKLISSYFEEIPAGEKFQRELAKEPTRSAEVRDKVEDNIQVPAVIHAYPSPARKNKDFYAMKLLGKLLSDGNSSRLHKALVEKNQTAMTVGAFPLNLEDPGLTIAYAICNLGATPEEVEAQMDEEIERVKNELISEQELKKLKLQVQTELVSANRRVAGIANSLASYHTFYGDASLINSMMEIYEGITAEQIQDVARKYLNRENRVVLYFVPKQQN